MKNLNKYFKQIKLYDHLIALLTLVSLCLLIYDNEVIFIQNKGLTTSSNVEINDKNDVCRVLAIIMSIAIVVLVIKRSLIEF